MKKPTDTQRFLSKKRLKRADRRRAREAEEYARLVQRFGARPVYTSHALRLLSDSSPYTPHGVPISAPLSIPETFSIIDRPEGALDTFYRLASITRAPKLREVVFNHREMRSVDLAAESILDYAALEMKREANSRHGKIRVRGTYPNDAYLKRYIRAIGIIKNLNIRHEFLPAEQESTLRIFQMRNRRYQSRKVALSLDFKERAVRDFVDHINSCLEDNHQQLTPESRRELADYTGEILANAEDHSGSHEWSIVGYLDNEHQEHLCEIAIFNFGKTIAETFLELPVESFARDVIDPYLERHSSRGFFHAGWRPSDLVTLIALQGHVSSKNESREDDRGQGTVEMIEFFQQVHRECLQEGRSCAKMAILSGSTHILFDGKHTIRPDDNGRKVIAFNDANDLSAPPDKQYVKNLKKLHFPGTVISIRFPMQVSHTEQVKL